jgi:mevalonate kinase
MSGERNTPVGTPVVIAPGRIILVGEYGVLEDGPVVVASIARYAKAQFVPRMDAMSKLVSEVVKRTQVELGEIFAALPPGSILVDDEDFRHNGQLVGLGSSAASSVAAVGALLETLGLPVATRRSLVFAIADAGRRALAGRAGSGVESLAATYGGLVRVSRARGREPKAVPVVPPPGLSLVLFSVAPSVSAQRIAEDIRRYARSDPVGFEDRTRTLRGLAQRFVDEIGAGRATGAIASASGYGDELAGLGRAAQVPIMNEPFDLARELARELGGVAKPSGAGAGSVGVAMFATPEAAALFRKAGPPCLTVIEADLDRQGVRCQDPLADLAEEPTASLPTTLPESPGGETASVECAAEDVDTAPTTVASTPPARQHAPGHRLRRRVVSVATLAAVMVLLALVAMPDSVRAPFHLSLPRTGGASHAAAQPSPPPLPPPPPPAPPPPKPVSVAPPPTSQELERIEDSERPPGHGSAARRRRKIGLARAKVSVQRRSAEAVPPRLKRAAFPVPRAGRLSSDDF